LYSFLVGGAETKRNRRNFHLLYGGAARLARTTDSEEVFEALESNLNMFLGEWARNRVFVHAGVVGWKGRAIMLPAKTYSGKSTLVAALLRAGATYYSDEFAVLDGRGYVHPYPRRLAIRQPQGPARRYTAEELGSRPGTEPLPVGLIALTKYQPGTDWRPRPVTPGQATLEVLTSTIPALRDPETALTTLHRITPTARCLKSSRGEADEMAERLLVEAAQ
jgi:hypothetical protein